MSKKLFSRFIAASIVWALAGTLWMVVHRYLPAPGQPAAEEIWSGAWIHLNQIGWLSFVAVGTIYYLLPQALDKPLYSERLGNVHFVLTNIAFVLMLIVANAMAYALDPLLAASTPVPQAMGRIMPLPLLSDIVNFFGWAVQLLFVYNIARTYARKAAPP